MPFDFPNNPMVDDIYVVGDVSYTWNGYAWIKTGPAAGSAAYVLKAGDTMAGFLTLNADPAMPLHAATRAYVDASAGVPPGGGQGEALVKDVLAAAVWGAPIDAGTF